MTDHTGEDHKYQVNLQPAPVDFVPQRVVSLVPSLTESLFDLDLGERIVGITDYCVRPADRVQSIPRVGGPKHPDIERILALQPDLVLVNNEENRREDAESLEAAGLTIWATGPRTVFETLNLLWSLMDVFDHAVMIPRVREIERAYDYTQAASSASDPIPVFAPIWRDPWMTFNRETYAHDILRVCGGANVFADRERQFPLAVDQDEAESSPNDALGAAERDQRYPYITVEEIVAAQPEIVLLPDEPYAFVEADAAFFRQLDIPAAHAARIYLIDGSLLTWHGTRTAYALRDLPGLFMGAE